MIPWRKETCGVEYSRMLSLLHSLLIELISPLPAASIADGEWKYHICRTLKSENHAKTDASSKVSPGPLCFVQPAHGRERHVNAKMQHTILICCKGQSLGTVFSLLIVYSHHHPSHGDYKRVEMSLHERAIYFPLTVFQVV